MPKKAKRPGRPRKVQILVAPRPMSLKTLAKIPGLQIPVLDAVDPRTRRMAAHAIGQAEAGKHVSIGITRQDSPFAPIQVCWLEKLILDRPIWFQYQGVFLHRRGGQIRLFSMREAINIFRSLTNRERAKDANEAYFFDPAELDEQTKELREELHRWDQ